VRLASGVIPALVDRSPASPGMRQLQTQLETVLTRGLRMRMETGLRAFVTTDDALKWSAGDVSSRRPIGFRVVGQPPACSIGAVKDVELAGHPVLVDSGMKRR
jgi:hypothetical protein